MLNAEQEVIFRKIVGKTKGAFLITGHAGTGKTYIAIELIKHYVKHRKSPLVLCPTHQAKYQFLQKLSGTKGVAFHTVASFLAQYPTPGIDGRLVFGRGGCDERCGNEIVIIDEVSMVSEYEVAELTKLAKHSLVILLGDFAQLRPVMKKQSTVYDKLPTFTLHEQQRNASRILQLCSKTRKKAVYPLHSSGPIRVHSSRDRMIDLFLDRLVKSDQPYNIGYLAYRNRVVADIQDEAHNALYGNAVFTKGQYLRLDNLCRAGNNGTILRVEKIVKKSVKSYSGTKVQVYTLDLFNLDEGSYSSDRFVSVEDMIRLRETLEYLYDLRTKAFHDNDMDYWRDLGGAISEIRDGLAFYSSPFVQTVHKAQGRSIESVYVDTLDISKGNDRRRLLYVAYSRAVRELHTIRVLA